MSALGQKQTFKRRHLMSALPPKADIGTGPRITFGAPAPAAWRYSPRSGALHRGRVDKSPRKMCSTHTLLGTPLIWALTYLTLRWDALPTIAQVFRRTLYRVP